MFGNLTSSACLFLLGVLTVMSTPAMMMAQEPAEEKQPKANPTVKKLSVSITPAPVPSLKYPLLPPERELRRGNAVVDYYRAFLHLPRRTGNDVQDKAFNEYLTKLRVKPLDEWSEKELAETLNGCRLSLQALDVASRYDQTDWQFEAYYEPKPGGQVFDPSNSHFELITDQNAPRELATFNRYRIRQELLNKDWAKANQALQAGIRLGKDIAEGPTMIRMLVGQAIIAVSLDGVLDWIGQPDSPNLYWSLNALPRPIFDPMPGLEGEFNYIRLSMPISKEFSQGVLKAERAYQLLGEAGKLFKPADGPFKAGSLLDGVGVGLYVSANAADSRKRLLELGQDEEFVKQITEPQAVGLRLLLEQEQDWDDIQSAFRLPYAKGAKKFEQLIARGKARQRTADPIQTVSAMTFTSFQKVYFSRIRTQRLLDAYQVIEAVKLHAAMNHSQLPETLADLELWIPDDPYTGKPFEYKRTDAGFELYAAPLADEPAQPHLSIRYEVTLRK